MSIKQLKKITKWYRPSSQPRNVIELDYFNIIADFAQQLTEWRLWEIAQSDDKSRFRYIIL